MILSLARIFGGILGVVQVAIREQRLSQHRSTNYP
jgi:hypothetical protein